VEYQWKLATKPDEQVVNNLQLQLGVDQLLVTMLVQRGITSLDHAKQFFRPSLDFLHDPFLMKDMDKAVSRIQSALEESEKILVYGDYDVDGTTAVSLMVSFFTQIGVEEVDYYIPDRYKEGYGISFDGIEYAEERGISLIIALDCGIRALDKVEFAKEKGIDFIICDHHLPHGEIPKAVAVLDHKRPDCPYPYKELTGCGIGLKLCQALSQNMDLDAEKWTSLLDLVAISSACDIVPITGENRTLVHLGMQQLNSKPRKGLKYMIENANKTGKLTVTDLVFNLGPRINAAGRIEHGKKAVELLLSDSPELAEKAGQLLEERNTERRELDQNTTQEALEMIAENNLVDRKATVLFSPNWHKGVVGITASRLMETYYRPTIVLTESNGKAVGSARSVKGFDVHEALEQCSSELEQFGGHVFAAGMTLGLDKVEAFQNKFEAVVAKSILPEQLIPTLDIDQEINFETITQKFWKIVKQFAPFGPDNMKPVFVTRNCVDAGWTKAVGDGSHLKLDVKQRSSSIKMGGIAFGMGELATRIKSKDPFDLVYTIEENEWQGRVSLQLMVKDLRFV
jgi:single-stranded-DNA-specific exonuclease